MKKVMGRKFPIYLAESWTACKTGKVTGHKFSGIQYITVALLFSTLQWQAQFSTFQEQHSTVQCSALHCSSWHLAH